MKTTQEQLTTLMNTGLKDLSNDNYDSAEMSFEKVIQQAPLYPLAYVNCATAQHIQQKNTHAAVNLDIAIALLPQGEDLAAAYLNRGLVLVDLENIDEAVLDLEKSKAFGFAPADTELERVRQLQSEPTDSLSTDFSTTVHSICQLARKEFSTKPLHSLALFKKAVDLDADSIEALFGMGLANSALGRIEQALENFNDVMKMEQPEYAGLKAETFYNRSAILKQKGELSKAIMDLEACLLLSVDDQVRFPVLGSAEKEQAMIDDIRRELKQWKKELN